MKILPVVLGLTISYFLIGPQPATVLKPIKQNSSVPYRSIVPYATLASAVKPLEAPQAVVVPEPVPTPAPIVEAVPEPVEAPVVTTYTGSHSDWMSAAGIDQSDFAAVDYIISHESSWNPNATEPNTLAHGLPQALPYSKTGCEWVDPVCQLRWASVYSQKYGGWQGSYQWWQEHSWW